MSRFDVVTVWWEYDVASWTRGHRTAIRSARDVRTMPARSRCSIVVDGRCKVGGAVSGRHMASSCCCGHSMGRRGGVVATGLSESGSARVWSPQRVRGELGGCLWAWVGRASWLRRRPSCAWGRHGIAGSHGRASGDIRRQTISTSRCTP